MVNRLGNLIPNWLSQIDGINGLKYIGDDPCGDPWAVYVETAFAPAGRAILVLLGFGMSDVIRAYFRPKGLRGHRRRRGKRPRRGRFRRFFSIPEIGEMIGHRLPGYDDLHTRHVSQGVRNMWLIDGALQRGLYYWMIVDVTNDFFAEWTSAIHAASLEQCHRTARFVASRDEGSVGELFNWYPVNLTTIEKAVNVGTHTGFYCNVGPGDWFVSFGARVTAQDPGVTKFESRIFDAGSPGSTPQYSEPYTGATPDTNGVIAAGSVRGPASIHWEVRSHGGRTWFADAHAVIQGVV